MDNPPISFDSEGKVRVLDAEKFKLTEELDKESREFIEKIREFSSTVHTIIDSIGQQAAKIEYEKLKAIGQRLVVDSERDTRKRKARDLQALIDEKSAELARLTAQAESLQAVEQAQRETIERLSNNEPGGL